MDSSLNTFEALNLLGSLESITRDHLPRVAKNSTPTASPSAPPQAAPTSQPPATHAASPDLSSYRTSKAEYKPALQDNKLLEALVQFKKEIETETKKQQKPPEHKGFKPLNLQSINVTPKPPGHFRRYPGIYQTICRTK